MSKIFRFKRFSIFNDKSAMKLTTDTVLLACSVSLKLYQKNRIFLLEVGTGTGALSLMLAQRIEYEDFIVDTIDIDKISIEEAKINVSNSPWHDRIRVKECAIQDFIPQQNYDYIISNPPFFEKSLQGPNERKNLTRHSNEHSFSYRELIYFAKLFLNESGILAMILPASEEKAVLDFANTNQLYLNRQISIKGDVRKEANRIIVEFSKQRIEKPKYEDLSVRKEGQYTQEYIALTRDFYI